MTFEEYKERAELARKLLGQAQTDMNRAEGEKRVSIAKMALEDAEDLLRSELSGRKPDEELMEDWLKMLMDHREAVKQITSLEGQLHDWKMCKVKLEQKVSGLIKKHGPVLRLSLVSLVQETEPEPEPIL